LPPRGSIQDELLKELFWRERSEKMASVGLIARVIARGLMVPPDELEKMLSDYADIVTQNRYTPQVAGERRRRQVEADHQKKADKARLEKIDKLTVPDEELPPPPKPRGRGRGRRK
jgi:hypothetical protein